MEPERKVKKTEKGKGAATYNTRYDENWAMQYPVAKVNNNPYAFRCIPCGKTLPCEHRGFADVISHCKSKTHTHIEKAIKETRNLSDMMPSTSGNNLEENTIFAEVLHTNFIAQHNISLATAEHLSPLYAKMFPDSKIAKHFRSRRTKTTCILRDAMYPALKKTLVEYMRENPFSLVHDGSSDSGIKKMNAACAFIFDVNNSKYVETKFYDMCATSGEDCGKAFRRLIIERPYVHF